MILLTAVLVSALFGAGFLMHRWKNLVEVQLRIDQCVGETAIALRNSMERIEVANATLTALRISEPLDVLAPPVLAAVRAAMTVIAIHRKIERVAWGARQVAWMLRRGCDSKDFPMPLPNWPWRELPPDPLGPRPLEWKSDREKILRITLLHSPRYSSAQVRADKKKSAFPSIHVGDYEFKVPVPFLDNWQANWASRR